MDSGRRGAAPVGVAAALVLVAGLVAVVARQGGVGGLAGEVLDRPWPARVTPTAKWSASVTGTGERLTVGRAEGQDFSDTDTRDGCPSCGFVDPQRRGRIVGGFSRATFEFEPGSSTNRAELVFPDGSRWRPSGRFSLDSDADLPFGAVMADGPRLRVAAGATMSGLIETAGAPVSAQGTFVGPAGQKVDRLTLPPGTQAGRACCRERDEAVPLATLTAVAGTMIVIDTTRDSEVAVAGTAHAQALDRSWDGLVDAVQGHGMTGTATWGGSSWTVTAESRSALQVWVDVWPVADTMLQGTVRTSARGGGCGTPCPTELRWENVGFATSQFYGAAGEGPGADDVHFRLNPSVGHDAGLGVRRLVHATNLARGKPVDSNLAPGDDADAGVNHGPRPATVVVRGNLPDLRFAVGAAAT